jgi:histidinol dehydrogenase
MRMLEGKAADAYVRSIEQRASHLDKVESTVRSIVDEVRQRGELALRKYARDFDGLGEREKIRVSEAEMRAAWAKLPAQIRIALQTAAKNIRRFCEWQKPEEWSRTTHGITLGQLVRPLDSVGCYVPGGRFPLLSTLLMTVIPAQVAGVKTICVVSPRPTVEVLAAASMLGVNNLFRVGGAQAIAALAYGTHSIPRVDKIVGPGNIYVTAAKKLVSFDCAIDMLAGPTEVVVVSDDGEPAFIAADLIAQAEHDPETLAIFITTRKRFANAVLEQVLCGGGGRPPLRENPVAKESLTARGSVLIARSRKQSFEWANRIAPEHITVTMRDLPLVQNAGSVFVGDYSAQAAGDYASGPNHVLPTAGAARFRGGLSVMDFVKLITVQKLSAKGLQQIGGTVVSLAETEGLRAHAESIRVRCANA